MDIHNIGYPSTISDSLGVNKMTDDKFKLLNYLGKEVTVETLDPKGVILETKGKLVHIHPTNVILDTGKELVVIRLVYKIRIPK